jgi:phospholipase/carboxylesterase
LLLNKVYLKQSKLPAKGCVIWMHGLGADASDMAGLADYPSLQALPLNHLFMTASVRPVTINAGMSMRAWYDIVGTSLTDREDKEGILESQGQIIEVIKDQIKSGFQEEQIILAGFSQGGAMALYTALHSEMNLGGVIALSAYLPLALECRSVLPKDTPIFIGLGRYDSVVLPTWTNTSSQWLQINGYNKLTQKDYAMEHAICPQEIQDVAAWLQSLFSGVEQ